MSSRPETSARPFGADARSGWLVVEWVVPAEARGVLVAISIVFALALAWASGSVPEPNGGAVVALPELLVDLNTAPEPVLGSLPHIGQTLVRQLVAARQRDPLLSLDDAATRVRGLGPSTVNHLRPLDGLELRSPWSVFASGRASRNRGRPRCRQNFVPTVKTSWALWS
jgi:hypothetical protein